MLKLFLNSSNSSYLREMEREFGESNNAIRQELKRLTAAGLLTSDNMANRKVYRANTAHPLFGDIQSILKKMVGIDKIVDNVTSRVGNLDVAYITGSFAAGIDSDTIELVLAGTNLDEAYIKNLVAKAENLVNRKIIYLILTKEQMTQFFKDKPVLLIWKKDNEKSDQ